ATNVGDLLQILQTGGTAIFNGTINSQGTIATPSALWVQGNAEFNGDIGDGFGLLALRVDGTSNYGLGATLARTLAFQEYLGQVFVNGDLTMSSDMGGALGFIRFDGGLDRGTVLGAPPNLTINTSGNTIFNSAVGSIRRLGTITTDAPGMTQILANMDSGALRFLDPVLVGGLVTLGSAGNTTEVLFDQTVTDDGVAGADGLTVNGASRTFNGDITNIDLTLPAEAGSTTFLNANFNGGSALFQNMTVLGGGGLPSRTITGTGDVEFTGGLQGGNRSLTINTPGTTTFGGDISGIATLTTDAAGMTVTAPGLTTIQAGSVNINDPLTLNGALTLTGTTLVNFASTIGGGGFDLTVNSPDTTFSGAVTGVGTLTTDAAGTTTIGADISGGTLNFNDALTLVVNAIMTGTTAVNFGSTIAGGGNDLTVNS
ncbi:MAG: hypothetical protein GY715_21570, partial [Planctomycetes bacterium]|nr:hypothetical protein [Planctomycetota bacterium]